MSSGIDFSKADEILTLYDRKESMLIAIMQDIQSEYNYLPAEILEHIADELHLSIAKVYQRRDLLREFFARTEGQIRDPHLRRYGVSRAQVHPHPDEAAL